MPSCWRLRFMDLRMKLAACHSALRTIVESNHAVFGHEGPVDACPRGICRTVLDVVETTQP